MNPSRWSRVKAIFSEAAELPPAERAGYVEHACGEDAELAAEVLKLLAGHEDTDTLDILSKKAGHSIGEGEVLAIRFKILKFVGRGGMGEVYEAEDLELRSRVALKILRPDLLDSPEFISRFRREVQIARQVTHANVCRIFDVGRDHRGGREIVFLTMEFLDGQTLGECMQAAGKIGTQEAFCLIRQMAEGLSALHAQGIVHRDFKPSNVMVVRSTSGAPRAVISDFGLARALETPASANLSRTGQVMGTPDYMAPEQLLGQPVTPAADIYALGLVMYEMVTGKKAFSGGRAIANAVQRVLEQPSPPRQQATGVTPEWDTVILQCLARDPAERPTLAQIVNALSGTVPLPRIRPTRRVHRKWVVGWAAAISILVVALFALGPRLPGWLKTSGSEAAIIRQHVALLPLNVLSDEPELRVFALGLMETITSRLSQFEGTKSTLVVVPASEVRAQEIKTAGDAKKKFQVTEAVEGTVQNQGDRIRLLLTVIDAKEMRQAETIVVDGRRSNALQLQDEAVTKLANALNLRLQPEYAREQQEMIPIAPGAYEFYLLARGYLQRSDQMQSIESAITLLKRALALDPQYALAHSGLGQAYLYKYELTRDPKWMDEALKSGREGLTLNSGLAETHISMGRIHLGTGQYREALHDFEQATSLDSRNHEAYQGLANAYAKLKDYARAEATYRKAISLRPGDWTGYRHLGIFYLEREEFDKAIAQYEKVIELSPDNAHGYVNLGAFHTRKENWGEAEKYFLRALELDPTRMSTLTNLAKVYYERAQFDRAIEYYKRALVLNDRSRLSWGNLGLTYWRKGDQEHGRPALERALQLLDAELLVNPKLADLHSYVGYYRAVLGRDDYQQALRMALKLDPDNGDVAARAAEAYAVRGDKARAIELIKQIIAKGSNIKSLQRSRDLRGLLSEMGILATQ